VGVQPGPSFAVESIYGGPDAFKIFVKAAHEQGIAVIVDVVYNHFGPGDLNLWQFDGWSENERGEFTFTMISARQRPGGDAPRLWPG